MTAFDRAQAEVDALTALLLEHGIEPGDAAPDTAPDAAPDTAPGTTDEVRDARRTSEGLAPVDRALLDAILAGETAAAPEPPAPRTRRVRRTVVQLAAVACAALVVLTSSTVLSRDDAAVAGPPALLTYGTSTIGDVYAGTAPSASSRLLELADVAAAQPAPPADAAERDQHVHSYAWYTATNTDENGVVRSYVEPVTSDTVLRPDGSATTREDRSTGLDVDGRVVDRRVDAAAGKVTGDDFPAGTVDAAWVRNLPSDTAGMRAALVAQSGGVEVCGTPSYCMSSSIQTMNGFWVVPPGTAATVWRTLAEQDDVYLLGDTTDRAGRKGVAVALMEPPAIGFPRADVLIISPTTGQLLSWEMLDAAPTTKEGAKVAAFQAILTAEYVG